MSRRGPNAPLDRIDSIHHRADYRLVPIATALWAGMLAGLSLSSPAITSAAATAVVAVVAVRGVSDGVRRTVLVASACLLAGVALGVARAEPVRHGPVAELAADETFVTAEAEVAADPAPRDGYVVGRLRILEAVAHGAVHRTRALVVLVADESWTSVRPGQRVRVAGRLEPVRSPGRESAVLKAAGDPDFIDASPSWTTRLSEPLRAGLRNAAASAGGGDARGLLPAMLVGDESLISNRLRDAMRDSGLAHLTAVSGMNVTIVLIMVLGVARWTGVRGYALHVVGVVAIIGFVGLARPDPSVVRAAVMGAIAIGGVVLAGHRRGLRALAAGAAVLLLADPWLARSAGFALSVAATGGILLLSPVWQRAAWWLPRPLAAAFAVPLAAQAACLPILVAIGGSASVVSVPANMLAAPAVAPITVISAGVALTAPIAPSLGAALAWLAAWPARWVAGLAHWCSSLPGAVVGWPGGGAGALFAVGVSAVLVIVTPLVLRRRSMALVAVLALVAALAIQPPRLPVVGWPPRSWLLLACDVGQGDALALRAGERAAVVVDAGPDPAPVRRCLDEMGIDHVPMLVLTHFDSDHVMGVPGVLAGRSVGRALVSPVAEPVANVHVVRQWLQEKDVEVDVASAGLRQRFGEDVEYEVVWPRRRTSSGSASNNASVVLRASVDGVSMLLTGDIEPEAQVAVRGAVGDLRVDVLKVPHHGSPEQDSAFLQTVDADVAVISVGENDYGHPSSRVVGELRSAGTAIARTDRRGTFAIVKDAAGNLAITER